MTAAPDDVLLDTMEALCRARGGRMTRQRRAVLACWWRRSARSRPTNCATCCGRRMRPSSPASVYRCLDFLMEHGLVHRLETTRSFIACDHPDHPHAVQFLICRQCGSVVEAEDQRGCGSDGKPGAASGLRARSAVGRTDGDLRDVQDGRGALRVSKAGALPLDPVKGGAFEIQIWLAESHREPCDGG